MPRASRLQIPTDVDHAIVVVEGREVRLTNLRKLFWLERGIAKRDLLQYYADVPTTSISIWIPVRVRRSSPPDKRR